MVCDRQALYAFTGTFSEKMELSWVIRKIWKRINKKAFHTIEAVVDTINECLYIAVPIDGAVSPNYVLHMDYTDGFSVEAVKWCLWQFPVPPTSIGLAMKDEEVYFRYASTDINKLEKSLKNDRANAIRSFAIFAYTASGYPMQQNHYCGIAMLGTGYGLINIKGSTLHGARTFNFPVYDLLANPEFYITRGFSVDTEKLSISIELNAPDYWMKISSYTIFCKPVWTTRPNYA